MQNAVPIYAPTVRGTVILAREEGADMGAVALAATIYFGSDQSVRQIVEVARVTVCQPSAAGFPDFSGVKKCVRGGFDPRWDSYPRGSKGGSFYYGGRGGGRLTAN
jgi:hypothetical protein